MTIQVELSPETESRLLEEAGARGVAAESYAGYLLQQVLRPTAVGTGKLSPQDVEAITKALTKGSEKLPVLPSKATERASFYKSRF